MEDCIFCKIIKGEIPSKKVYEDEHTYAFHEISPTAPTHVLVIPKSHISGLMEATHEHCELLGRVLISCSEVAKIEGLHHDGYRTVINTREDAGQSVFHLHAHVIGGRELTWPPG